MDLSPKQGKKKGRNRRNKHTMAELEGRLLSVRSEAFSVTQTHGLLMVSVSVIHIPG